VATCVLPVQYCKDNTSSMHRSRCACAHPHKCVAVFVSVRVCVLVQVLLEAIVYCHDRNIVHRDLKVTCHSILNYRCS
jgi:serine/threonine protein kinase